MASKPANGYFTNPWRVVVVSTLVTLVGFNLRTVILAVPPILPLIQRDLGLSYTATGVLTALPILVLGCCAWPAGMLVGRIGGRRCVTIGLILLSLGTFLRVLWPSIISLYCFTILLSLGITIAQTAVPVLARRWFPRHIGMVAALFSDGLIIGEAVGAGITVPIMGQFLGNDAWHATFVVWTIPIIIVLALWFIFAPPEHIYPVGTDLSRPPRPHADSQPSINADHVQMGDDGRIVDDMQIDDGHVVKGRGRDQSVPTGSRVNALHLGILLGGGSLIYFNMNSWIAVYNTATHHAGITSLALGVLNVAQLPVSLGVTFFAQWLAGRRAPFIVAGIICGIAITGWVLTPAALEPWWAALLGGSSALVFTLGIALPPLLASQNEVARLTGITLSLNYCVAFIGPLLGGQLWDRLHIPALAFFPVLLASISLIVLSLFLPSRANFGLIAHTGPVERDETTTVTPIL
ncbi:MAG TPA: MFS transporter [Ktedonobacteraceae bacterium]|nr:MFS transporter [Ktedonobacteraceae bacterium]